MTPLLKFVSILDIKTILLYKGSYESLNLNYILCYTLLEFPTITQSYYGHKLASLGWKDNQMMLPQFL